VLAAVLRNKPKARRILLDLPHVSGEPGTPRCGRNRRQVHVDCGDFFVSVPAGGDVYHQHLEPSVPSLVARVTRPNGGRDRRGSTKRFAVG
jgi:hypothetical protein